MRRDTMLNFNGDGDKPEACPFGDGSREDLALPPERLGHIDFAELRDRKEMPIDTKFIIVEVKREAVMLLALEMRETRILAIFARMFQFGLCPLFLHAEVIGERSRQMAKLLFRSAFRDLGGPGELFFLDAVVLALEILHLDPTALGACLFPLRQRPVERMASHPAGFAKIGD